jgi:hypothetical protein
MTDHELNLATIALLRGAADNREPIEQFAAAHNYPSTVVERARAARIDECKRTPLTEWHASTWDEMVSAADRLEDTW